MDNPSGPSPEESPSPEEDNHEIRLEWRKELTRREAEHVRFCSAYAADYLHGAPDHLSMTVIAQLAGLLDLATADLAILRAQVNPEL